MEIRTSSFAHELFQRDRLHTSAIQLDTSAMGLQGFSENVLLSVCQVGKFM